MKSHNNRTKYNFEIKLRRKKNTTQLSKNIEMLPFSHTENDPLPRFVQYVRVINLGNPETRFIELRDPSKLAKTRSILNRCRD